MEIPALADVTGELAELAERVRCDRRLVPSGLVDGQLSIERAGGGHDATALNAALSNALDEVLAAACTADSHDGLRRWCAQRIDELDRNVAKLAVGPVRARVDARRLVFECLSERLRPARRR